MHYSKRLTTYVALAAVAGAGVLATGCGSGSHRESVSDGTDLHAAPNHLRWKDFHGVQVPVADQGPSHIDGAIATGYDRSPAGAGLAAIESTVRMSIADDIEWPQVGQRLLAPGPGRDRWATARVQVSITGGVPAGAAPRVVGYTITDYTTTRADVAIYTRQADGSLTRNATTVVRRGGTWLLELPEAPRTPTVAAITHTPGDMVRLPATLEEPTR